MEKPLIPKCSQDLWFGILISFLFCFVFLSFDYSTFWGVNNGATLLVNKQNHPVGFVKNQTVLSTTHLIPDSCSGRYVYIHDDLPSKFNSDLLNNCKLLTRGTDKPNLCPYFENWGFGPAIENTEGVLANTSWFSTNQFTLEVIFHNKMKQYECLTKNSTLASAIYVPFYAGLDASLHLWDSNLTVRDASARDLNAWLSKRPEWKTMWGRDHFLVGGRISWDFRRQTDEISDWGSKLRFLPESLNMSMLSVEGSSWRNDYAIPYPTNFHPAKDSDVVQWQNRMRKLERPHLFTFVGAPRPDQQNSIRGKIIDQCLASSVGKLVDCSSGGIKCDNPASVTRMFQSSVYCLQPTGDSYTRKSAFDSILAGCIPVFFHPGTAYSQYLWHLPKNHTKYSVFIPVRYVEDLKEGLIEKTLVGISKEKELEMREEVIRLIPKLVYADPMSRLETEDAFDLSVKGILETIENVRKTIREGRDPSISFADEDSYKYIVAGGAAAYVQSRLTHKKHNSFGQYNGLNENKEADNVVANDHKKKKPPQKRGGLKSLQVLAAILLSEMGQVGVRDLLSLVGIVVLRTALSNRLAKVQGFLFRAAFLRRVPLFFRLISENILLCFLASTMHSTSKYITGTLSLRFRKILTKHIHSHYFENIAYYKMSHVDGRITNPEQRIASDVPRFCSELSEIVQDDLTAVTDGLLYSWRLCSYASPKYIFWILAYVLGAGGMIRNFSPPFGKLMSKEQQLEGEYRQLHSRLRTHAESVAFYGGENREESHIQKKFNTLVGHLRVVLHDHWWFGMIQDFLLKYLGATVAVILIIEPFFSGSLRPDTSTLGRAEMLSNLRYHTSVIISLFQSMGTLASSSRKLNRLSGYADRIHELMVISRELSAVDNKYSGNKNCSSEADYIEFAGVKVVTPTGNVLVDKLSLRVEPGSNLLITGPNGSGKSSLFRVLGGLWPLVSGHIVKPGVGTDLNKEIFYVPQRPYTAVGTLRDQLIYPLIADQEVKPLTREEMAELLRNVDLQYLLDRYPPEEEINWGDELSLGEQQRLGMARLFYHKPKFAILDECTSAVTTDMEERFCAKVRAMGTSCITISHRPALVAFHDVVLSLDGEGGWSVHEKRDDSLVRNEGGNSRLKLSETNRQNDAMTVQRAFALTKDSSNSKSQSYIADVVAVSPSAEHNVTIPSFPQLQRAPRALPLRAAAMFKVLIPTLVDKQGAQLLAVAFLVVSRTWISDRIASLNGTTVKFVLEQDKASFIHLIGVSVLQSAASSFIAPSLRHLKSRLALGWRIRLTQHLLKNYLRNNAFYKVFNMSSNNIDADQRITQDLEKLTSDLSGLVTGLVKPSVDILWFTWRMKLLTGQRGVTILYAYMLLGLGLLRAATPEFGDLTSRQQQLEGTFRFMHERLRAHAESVAFFGGGYREKAMVESKFKELLHHSSSLLKKQWLFGILDDFITKQLPHNVTWGLSLLYAIEHKGDRALISTQGELAHALRFLASVVSQSFLAFGDILELHRKFLELSGSINRVFELEELLDAAQSVVGYSGGPDAGNLSPSEREGVQSEGVQSEGAINFSEVDIITPSQKLLARKLTCDIVPGKSLLVTGPNGSGKSSVFRVLRGLWPIMSGRITRPSQDVNGVNREVGSGCGVFYVPQRPYTCLGTLRDQIIYPLSFDEAEMRALKLYQEGGEFADSTNILDMRLRTILENVRLSYLLEREDGGWDANLNWEDTLSLGEQQRLGMARLFFHKPKFAILDECTNATSVDVEEQLYRLANGMGITVVTSSQRPALIPFHSLELRLIDGEGNWELRSIKQ